ncbi:MAG: undecaprenyldiphospho-muramoylpentapeptide beta-N-acetylglucosaminyltransferase [Clostridia bacterium]|nr:undecaprenyldiphospho-muramoylpentapeptide beta-N-acetylglucosaminyltransferase [Clostridia bacterium]
MKFVFTCGGTAGHINPAIAVAGRLREAMPDAKFLFIGAEDRMEADLVPRAGYELKTVKITNIRRGFKPEDISHNLKTVKNVLTSTAEARRIIDDFGPDVVVGTGGYVCYPVLKAASGLGIPTAVHESNAVPGLTTKMLERIVDTIMVGFEESRANYRHPERVVVTGTPVRGGFLNADKRAAKELLSLDPHRPLLVSVWGSLGASRMNGIMKDFIIKACEDPFFDLIHSAGKAGYSQMAEALEKERPDAFACGMDVRDYIYDMHRVMAAADLVICRAGAATLAELTAMGKPAVLVPSPNVTNNHQEKNARVLENAGGAKVMLESEFDAETLYGVVSRLLRDPEQLERMSENIRSLGVTDATERIADIVLGLAFSCRIE